MEMRCYRKILHISYKDHVTNKEVRAKIQQANRLLEDRLTIEKKCKPKWYGPVSYTHLIQRPCYQRGSPCQDPAGKQTTQRTPDDRKEMQTAVVWSCFPFIRSGQNHLTRHSERGKKTRRTKEEVGRHQGMDRPGVCQVPQGSGEQGKMEKTGCKIICSALTTLTVRGLMMMMMMMEKKNMFCAKLW